MSFASKRSTVLLALIIACLMSWGCGPAAAQAERKSITALTPAELMSLRRGVATMMANNGAARGSADFRRSWIFWANMHAHFGADCAGPIAGNNMNGVRLWTAQNSAENQTWCACQHHNNQFLTWHRMYLYYFERVLRQAAGNPSLRLPYWDYAADGRLPAAVRAQTYVDESGRMVPNPLYVAARRPQLNSGAQALLTGVTSAANAMAAGGEGTFRTRIETAPHGAVHCALPAGGCPNGLMGATAPAALDPIFYLHHANIDRLYECWLRVDEARRLPTSTVVLDQTFAFVDGDGSVRQRRVRDMLTTAQLGYGYTQGRGCPAPAAAPATLMAEASTDRLATSPPGGGSTELGRGTTEVPAQVEETRAAPAARSSGAPVQATVTIVGLEAHASPGVLYNVYLANDAGQREQIGVIDFFGFGAGNAVHGRMSRTLDFDATDAVKVLGLAPGKNPKIVFETTTGVTDSTPEAAAAEMPEDAHVTFRAARLRFGG
jgi:hypothetical protein